MRRLITALVIILVVAAICISGLCVVDDRTAALNDCLQNALSAWEENQPDAAASKMAEFAALWEKSEPILFIFVGNDMLKSVSVQLDYVNQMMHEKSLDFSVEAARLKSLIHEIRESEQFSLDVFF